MTAALVAALLATATWLALADWLAAERRRRRVMRAAERLRAIGATFSRQSVVALGASAAMRGLGYAVEAAIEAEQAEARRRFEAGEA